MCGISGIYSFNNEAERYVQAVEQSIQTLKNRGPEVQRVEVHGQSILGHARLAILDTSSAGNQPFTDVSGRYTLIFNGEIYNYRDFYNELLLDGVQFRSTSDSEVLLYLYIKYGKSCLEKLNGFFAFAVYDSLEHTLFVARDRMGIKPLYIIQNTDFFGFSSELKGVTAFPFERKLNNLALTAYFQLNYIPAPLSILQDVEKLEQGTMLTVSQSGVKKERYFNIPRYNENPSTLKYNDAICTLKQMLTESVQRRMIADVPLGTFLSGGIDSSVISAIASRYCDSLQTFSIGFKKNPFYDETEYARLVARKIGSQHTEIQIDNQNLEDALFAILGGIDEPFADSSAIAVHVLCKYVKPHVTVALSGDGADEMFAGYNKHLAHYNHFKYRRLNRFISAFYLLFNKLPQSRTNAIFNAFRKLAKYSQSAGLTTAETYWKWCSVSDEQFVHNLLLESEDISSIKSAITSNFTDKTDINDVLFTDQNLVLPYDMLTKVDRMSMDNSLEVRTPFLDHNLVAFVNSLPAEYKINGSMKKRILQDAFREELPSELYNRPKKGFEVPLQAWSKTIFKDLSANLLSKDFVESQGIFNFNAISKILDDKNNYSHGDNPAQLWALLVFQAWWKRTMA